MREKRRRPPDENPDENKENSPAPPAVPQNSCREVTVAHLDSPPPLGKQSIHPRRPAPIVPTQEERTGEQSSRETGSGESSRD